MQPLAADTPAHIEAEIIDVLRSLAPWRKLELARDMNRMADQLAMAGLRLRHPAADERALAYRLAVQRLAPDRRDQGAALLEGVALMSTPVDPLALALHVGSLLDRLGIPYLIGGSVAAIVHGEYRTTRDLDVVLNLAPRDARALIEGLQADFTFLPSDITEALARLPEVRNDWRQRASFCAYDKTTGYQIDVYLSSGRPFEQMQLQRAVEVPIPGEPGGTLRVASAEDTILAKLEWYKITPSDRQWRDIQAILRVQDTALNLSYLRRWAADLAVSDLLDWALRGEAPLAPGDNPQQQRMF
jgi:nucleotidyltransferase AbiEii toxin of type IV toxin-antitoxin system